MASSFDSILINLRKKNTEMIEKGIEPTSVKKSTPKKAAPSGSSSKKKAALQADSKEDEGLSGKFKFSFDS